MEVPKFNAFSHIRFRPCMYIGRKGNGECYEDGLYAIFRNIVKYVIDNCKASPSGEVCIKVDEKEVTISSEDVYISFEQLNAFVNPNFINIECLAELTFKILIALSQKIVIQSTYGGQTRQIIASRGNVVSDEIIQEIDKSCGINLQYELDEDVFEEYHFKLDIIESVIEDFAFCNPSVIFKLQSDRNCKCIRKPNGMLNLVEDICGYDTSSSTGAIHIKTEILDLAIAPSQIKNGSFLKSYVNGVATIRHGKHVNALIDILSEIFNEHFHVANFPQSILPSLVIAINIYVDEPQFSSCMKGKLLSDDITNNPKISFNSYFRDIVMPAIRCSINYNRQFYEKLGICVYQ